MNWPQNDYLAGNLVGVAPTQSGAARRRGEAIEPVAALLAADRSAAARRQGRLARAPAARRHRRHRGRAGEVSRTSARRGASGPCSPSSSSIAGPRRARQDRRRRAGERPGARSIPTRSASAATASTCTRRAAATTTSTSRRCRSRFRSARCCPCASRTCSPACKNIGTTHITNGCYRLHPVEWNIGEAAGALAAFAHARGVSAARRAGHARAARRLSEAARQAGCRAALAARGLPP